MLQDRRYLSLEKARNKSLQVDWVAEPAPGKCPLPSAIIACQLGGYTTVQTISEVVRLQFEFSLSVRWLGYSLSSDYQRGG